MMVVNVNGTVIIMTVTQMNDVSLGIEGVTESGGLCGSCSGAGGG